MNVVVALRVCNALGAETLAGLGGMNLTQPVGHPVVLIETRREMLRQMA